MKEKCENCEKRIWELDFLRGFAIVLVVIVHFFYMKDIFTPSSVNWTDFTYCMRKYGGIFFVILSGVSNTLGSGKINRGLFVFFMGLLLTFISHTLYNQGIEGEKILIDFGVLSLIGLSMIIYPVLKDIDGKYLLILGIIIILIGYMAFSDIRVPKSLLLILGLKPASYVCFDYFPIFPHLGWAILGNGIGKLLYKDKKTKLEIINSDILPIRSFSYLGRKSIFIYLFHLPIVYILVKTLYC